MSIPILDSFIRANESPLTATNWGIRSWSGHKIVANKCVPVVAAGEYPESAWKTSVSPTCEACVTLAVAPTVNSASMSLLYRCQSHSAWDDYYRLQALPDPGNDLLALYKVISGASTLIGSGIDIGRSWANGDRLSVRVSGSTHEIYLNDVLVGVRTDSSILTGNYIGIGNDASAGTIGFSNFGGRTIVGSPATVTSWSLQSPDGVVWQPSISVYGIVTWLPIGAPITSLPPVYLDQNDAAVVHIPTISNAGILSLTAASDTGHDRAALLDANGTLHIGSVSSGITYFIAPSLTVGDLVTFGLYDEETVQLLVKSIEPGQDLTAQLTFVDAAPGVHLAASGQVPPFESHITMPQRGQERIAQPLIDLIASDETVMLMSGDGSFIPRIVVSLHFSSGAALPAAHLEAQHRLTGSQASWERQLFAAASTIEVSIMTVLEGYTYDLRFRSVGNAGQVSDWVTIEAYGVIGKTAPPPDVSGLSINGQQLVWLYPDLPPDFDGFRVRVHVGERTSWGDAMPLHDGLVSHTSFFLFRDTGQRTYLVKAVDTSGNESLNPGTFFVDYGALETANVVELVDLKDIGFPGTIVNGSVIGGNLVASSDTLFWKSDGLPFWTYDAAVMWPGTFQEMSYIATIVPQLIWLKGTLLIDTVIQANGWRIDYAQDSGALFWLDPLTKLWTGNDNTLFWSGLPSTFAPWPGQLTGYTRQAYYIRITTAAGNIQGTISELQAIFDMEDIEEILLNVPISIMVIAPSGGEEQAVTRLPLTKAFSAVTIVAPTVLEDGSGTVRIRVLDKEMPGPLVTAVDQNGISVNGHGDFIVKGY